MNVSTTLLALTACALLIINNNIKNKTNNLVFIDVYENYVVVQFLADDNGEKIYMEGRIGEV